MRCLISAGLVVVAVSAAACGGRVDDPAPSSGTAPGTNSPTNDRSAPAASGCAGACDHMRACAPSIEDRSACLRSCEHEFSDPARAQVYGACIQALPCREIERDLSMDFGPIGQCYAKAGQR